MSDQAVKKRYLTIFFDLLGELYVHILSVKVFVKIIDSIFVYGGECVINTTYVQTTYWRDQAKLTMREQLENSQFH